MIHTQSPTWIETIDGVSPVISYHADGITVARAEYIDAKGNTFFELHWYANGIKHKECWRKKGNTFYRADGPAVTEWHQNGQLKKEIWCEKESGAYHREDGPSCIAYFENGSPKLKEWMQDGYFYRSDKIARIWYDEAGDIFKTYMYDQKDPT